MVLRKTTMTKNVIIITYRQIDSKREKSLGLIHPLVEMQQQILDILNIKKLDIFQLDRQTLPSKL